MIFEKSADSNQHTAISRFDQVCQIVVWLKADR
jgi:hypothetical protein